MITLDGCSWSFALWGLDRFRLLKVISIDFCQCVCQGILATILPEVPAIDNVPRMCQSITCNFVTDRDGTEE